MEQAKTVEADDEVLHHVEADEEVLPRVVVMDEFRLVPLAKIVEWKEPRQFSREDVVNMGSSLRIHGQIHELTVEPLDEKAETYTGITGRLRFEGAEHAHISELKCKIKRFTSESERVSYMLAENLHRLELNALQKAEWLRRYRDALRKELPEVGEASIIEGIAESIEKLTGEKAATKTIRKYLEIDARIGKQARSIALPRDSKTGSFLKISHLEQICRMKDDNKQAEFLSYVVNEQWTVGKLKKVVDEELGLVVPAPSPKPISTTTVKPILSFQGDTYRIYPQETTIFLCALISTDGSIRFRNGTITVVTTVEEDWVQRVKQTLEENGISFYANSPVAQKNPSRKPELKLDMHKVGHDRENQHLSLLASILFWDATHYMSPRKFEILVECSCGLNRKQLTELSLEVLKREVDEELSIVTTESSRAEAIQTVTCQQCKASLLLIHNEDGTHKLLVKQRRPAA